MAKENELAREFGERLIELDKLIAVRPTAGKQVLSALKYDVDQRVNFYFAAGKP